jgi:hypothetical protein
MTTLRRCRYKGLRGVQRWVGMAVIANNFPVLGRTAPQEKTKGRLNGIKKQSGGIPPHASARRFHACPKCHCCAGKRCYGAALGRSPGRLSPSSREEVHHILTTPIQPISGTCMQGTRVSSSPSKIPYGEFSPVRLQTGIPPRPSPARSGSRRHLASAYARLKSLSRKRATSRSGTGVQA